jgi:hypothetical protein
MMASVLRIPKSLTGLHSVDLSSLKTFCGNDGFCFKIRATLFSSKKAGLHIMLGGHDVTLGKLDASQYITGKAVDNLCSTAGMSNGAKQVEVDTWNNVLHTVCG